MIIIFGLFIQQSGNPGIKKLDANTADPIKVVLTKP